VVLAGELSLHEIAGLCRNLAVVVDVEVVAGLISLPRITLHFELFWRQLVASRLCCRWRLSNGLVKSSKGVSVPDHAARLKGAVVYVLGAVAGGRLCRLCLETLAVSRHPWSGYER